MAKFLIALLLVAAGAYYYQSHMKPAGGSTMKDLLDRVSSTPVTADEAKVAFNLAATQLCSVNGTDPANGFGTTDECLNRLSQGVDAKCVSLAIRNPEKPFTSQAELKSAFSTYLHCAGNDLAR